MGITFYASYSSCQRQSTSWSQPQLFYPPRLTKNPLESRLGPNSGKKSLLVSNFKAGSDLLFHVNLFSRIFYVDTVVLVSCLKSYLLCKKFSISGFNLRLAVHQTWQGLEVLTAQLSTIMTRSPDFESLAVTLILATPFCKVLLHANTKIEKGLCHFWLIFGEHYQLLSLKIK